MIAAVGDSYLRTADLAGESAFSKNDDDDQSIVSVLRAESALVVVAISTNADGYNDVTCSAHINNHWEFKEHTISKVKVYLPDDMVGKELTVREVNTSGDFVDPEDGTSAAIESEHVSLEDVGFPGSGTHVQVRIFVIE